MKKPRCIVNDLIPDSSKRWLDDKNLDEVKKALQAAWTRGYEACMKQERQVISINLDIDALLKSMTEELNKAARQAGS